MFYILIHLIVHDGVKCESEKVDQLALEVVVKLYCFGILDFIAFMVLMVKRG